MKSGPDLASPGFLCAHQNRVGFVSVPPILVCGCVVTSVLGAYGCYLPSCYSFCADTARCGLVASSTGTLSWPSYAPMHAGVQPPFAALFTSAPPSNSTATALSWPSCAPMCAGGRCREGSAAKGRCREGSSGRRPLSQRAQRPKAAVAKGQRPKAACCEGCGRRPPVALGVTPPPGASKFRS